MSLLHTQYYGNGIINIIIVRDSQSRSTTSPDNIHLTTDHLHLQPPISTPSNTRFTQTLIVRSTTHYPEPKPDPVCTYLCILTFQISYDPLEILLQIHASLRHSSSGLPLITLNRNQTQCALTCVYLPFRSPTILLRYSFKYTLHSDTHRLVYRSLPRTDTRPSVHLPVYTYLSDLLRSSWDTPSNTRFTQTLIVRSTTHYPEPTPDPVCTYLCILTFQISYDPPEILLQIHASLRHSSSGLPLITPNWHQTQCALTCVYSPTILLRYSFKYTLHSDTHRPVYHLLPWTETRPSVHLPVYTYLSDLLRSSWDTPSNTRFTQTLIVRSTTHYPEPTPDPVCTYLCILTFQISYDPPEILLQIHASLRHSSSGLPLITPNRHQTQCALTCVYLPFRSPTILLRYSFKYTLHSDTHRPVYRSLPRTDTRPSVHLPVYTYLSDLLRSSWDTPSNTRFTQTLIVRSTAHYPELTPDPVCTYLCILSYDPPEILLQIHASLRHSSSGLPLITLNRNQTQCALTCVYLPFRSPTILLRYSFKYTLHSDTHRPVYHSLPRTDTRPSVHLPVYTYLSDLLRSSWDTPSNTRFTQTLIVWSTAHYPEPTPDPVCTYLCILTFQISYDPPEILLQIHASLRHSSSGLPLITPNWHQTQCALTCVYLPFRSPTILLRYSFKYTLHSDTHRPVYHSLPRTDTRPSVHLPVYTYLSDLLRSSWDTPSNTRFTQTLIVRSTTHYPEPKPDPVCTCLCILTFQISYDPPEILLQIHASLRHSSSGLPLITPNRHQTQCALTCVYLPFRSPTILLRYSFKYTLHSDTHRPVYRSLPRTDTRPSVHLPVYTLLRSSWDTPSNTCFTQTLIVWSTAHYPEPTPDPVCTYLCILTFQISYDPPEILLQIHASLRHSSSGLPLITPNWHQTQCALTCVYLPFRSPTILLRYSFKYTLHSDTHRRVYRSLPRTDIRPSVHLPVYTYLSDLLRSSWDTPSNTRFTQTLIVRSTAHYPEPTPDPVCTYLCILTFQISYDPPEILLQIHASLRHSSSGLPLITPNRHQTQCALTCVYSPTILLRYFFIESVCSWFPLSIDPANEYSHQLTDKTFCTVPISKIVTCLSPLTICIQPVNKSSCCFTHLLFPTLIVIIMSTELKMIHKKI